MNSALPAARSVFRHPRSVLALAVSATVALAAARAEAVAPRCAIELQNNVCLEANPSCPAVSSPKGVNAGDWPAFQANVQHTGQSGFNGPTCDAAIWNTRLVGRILSSPVLAQGNPGEPQTLFVPVGKAPVCALDPANGAVRWCETDNQGKRADRSSPVIGNGDLAYIGTRDNDMWAIQIPPLGGFPGHVAWRQKVCTDGDITVPPIIGGDGLVYMASDSLGAGTLMAMCPGTTRQVKWCLNPVGGGIRNASPALSPSGNALYVTIGGGILGAYQPQTGALLWQAGLEPKGRIGRNSNLAPVVNPNTGRIYVGLREGLWAVDPPTTLGGSPTISRFLDTRGARQRLEAPAALDLAHGRVIVGASKGPASTLYALDLAGNVVWQRSDLGRGKFQNNPPVVDAAGRIYLTLDKSLIALNPNGTNLWRREFPSRLPSSPILANGRVYVGTTNGEVYAIGDCA
jgi:outer membrane protein assembly factor BamB